MQDIITDEVLAKAAEGDIAAFESIYKATSGFVYNVAYRVVYNAHDAEEITQEVFLKVYKGLKNFRKQSSLKTWIYRIAANSAINYAKKTAGESRRRDDFRSAVDLRQVPAGTAAGTPRRYEEAIEMLLKVLNPDQRLCVVLRSIEGLSYREIARTLKVNINTIRSRLKRARSKLITVRKEVVGDEM
ncbi:MAG: RNA polymerase sigma factor [Candidatus Omnitrophota bacterium]